jgi:uncharacterized protein YjbJ (UPF0337 family)
MSTASRSGYDSASDKAQGRVKEAAGKLTGDKNMEEEGITQHDAEAMIEEDILKPWHRERAAEGGDSETR